MHSVLLTGRPPLVPGCALPTAKSVVRAFVTEALDGQVSAPTENKGCGLKGRVCNPALWHVMSNPSKCSFIALVLLFDGV